MKINLTNVIYMFSKYFIYGFAFQLLTLNFVLATAANGQYKSIDKVSIELKNGGQSLGQFFNQVESLTPYNFSFDKKDIRLETEITISKRTGTVESFLVEVAKQTSLSFRQVNNSIDVRKDRKNSSSVIPIQELISVTGNVVDATGEPMPGVTVVIEGTSRGTVTDIDGNYSIEVEVGAGFICS